ncbi:hypothetical protein L596_016378 [Steinernema carpocapsae]|uniref:Uncharacterized protein n=1 Tax=Steinernema carpocapsae TaxID=34508 RepID=A0A4U5NIS5_STECR|nr:hypothetical protein L596_016378 [Steinernema carpocapsae]
MKQSGNRPESHKRAYCSRGNSFARSRKNGDDEAALTRNFTSTGQQKRQKNGKKIRRSTTLLTLLLEQRAEQREED